MELFEKLKAYFGKPMYEDYVTVEENRVVIKRQEIEDFCSYEESHEVYVDPAKAIIRRAGFKPKGMEDENGIYTITW